MKKHNFSNVLFDEIKAQQKAEVRGKAKQVASGMANAERNVAQAEKALRDAKKHAKKLKKALKKFKETGNIEALAPFNNGYSDPDIPF